MVRNKRHAGRNSAGVERNADSAFSLVEDECERIVNASKHGNHIKALNLMKDLCSKYENSLYEAFVNRVQGTIFVNVASRSNDPKDKKRYYEDAVESAKRAVSLSPNCIAFSHFYANLLYEVANEGRDYEEVVQECERALAIEDDVDPLMESLQDQYGEKYPTAQSRVLYIKTELRSLIQKSNIASISIWMKNLANEEKFEFMPVRRIVEGKTVEDQMAAALFLLKQSPRLGNEVNSSSHIIKGLDSGPLERRKHGDVRRTVSSNERREWVQPYWNSMSLDRKKEFLKVKIADFQEHITALNNQLPSKVIVEALSFCKEKKEWHFMICCHCNKKISEIVPFVEHIELVHIGRVPLKQQSVFPKYVENDWVEMICDRSWEPLDLNAAARILEERPLDFVDKESLLRENWPVSHDSQCAELLEEIQAILDYHVKLQYLSESYINSMSKYAVMALQNHPQLLKLNVHQTHLCICFLGAQELSNILTVLQEIVDSCEHNTYSGASTADIDDSNNLAQDAYMERIAFSQDDSVVVSINDGSSDNSPETDALLSSMYADSLNPENFASCTPFEYEYMIEEKAQKGLQILQQLEKDFKRLQASIEKKLDLLSYQDALPVVGYLCVVARTKIMSETDFQCQTPFYESVLRNRKEELIKTGTTISDDKFELNAITCVLDEAEFLGSDEVDESRVREAIRRQGRKNAVEIIKMDARIMSIHAKRMYLFQEHARASKHDFRTILIPLLKSFLRARLEDLYEKAIVDELILDSKSSVGSGVDNLKLVPERKKDRKKSKKSRNNSGPKVTNNDKSLGRTAEVILLPDDHDEECHSTEIAASGTNADTDHHYAQLREEDYKNKLELEAEERKLEEALENQRQMEYEAKQKSLASQHEVSLTTIGQEEIEIASEGKQREETIEDQRQTKDGAMQKHPVEQHREKDEIHHILEGAEDKTTDECMLSIGSVNARVILTDREQQPMPQKEHCHGIEQPTIGHHSPIDRNIPHKKHPETSDSGNEVIIKVNVMDVHERGLKIVLVEHNSFPNVIIQSLWPIRLFQDELGQRSSVHAHVGDSFLVCALCDILVAPTTKEREANPLRVALSKMLSRFFHKGPMNDASEVLKTILSHLHQLFTPSPYVSVTESVDSNHHKFNMFKLDIFERMDCYYCGLQSRYRKHTSLFRKINANDLRKAKLMRPKYSFDELINLVEMNHHLACDPVVSGCGALNHIEHDLTTSPHVFTAFLEWQNDSESVEDIAQTVEALSNFIDIRLLYRGLNTRNSHCLVSMVCYFGQHYCCFGYNEDGKWILHDDKTIKVVGGWNDVVTMCKTEHMKPNVLFYEAVY